MTQRRDVGTKPDVGRRHEDLMTMAKLVDESADCQLFPSNFLKRSLLRDRGSSIRSDVPPQVIQP